MDFTLVSGGAGFIGSHLVEELLSLGRKVLVLDDLSTGKLENLPESENLTFVKGSITDRELLKELFSSYNFSTVFHLAAVASVHRSVEEPLYCHRVNFDGTLYLLEESRRAGVDKFVFASSAAVYGDLPELPKREDVAVRPITPYAVDKYASERYSVNSFNLYGLKATALRFFNVYGERQDSSSPYSGVISIFIDRIKKFKRGEKTTIEIFGDGRQTRDFIYVKDVVKALLIAEKEKTEGEVYNVATGKEVSLLELLETLKELVGELPPIRFLPPRKGDIRRSYADVSKLGALGFSPSYSLKEGLERLLKWEI
ncbi:NAD-dependent epimerase/dehydratase family protein [Thermovibrio sp.]